jgi:hypothetical protein
VIAWLCDCRPIVSHARLHRSYQQTVILHGPECGRNIPPLVMRTRQWRQAGQRVTRVGASRPVTFRV